MMVILIVELFADYNVFMLINLASWVGDITEVVPATETIVLTVLLV